ncbi:SoxR reducing system RseC family protein [Clostridium formicaceticum]|uniref:Sigma E positive regulator RseC/MucC n=1 Tax=Clostridium formicaceticum TaxID=1497 RepID=A0AAC9RIW5_9CLOT|nr:SoxR reducing system RseC family protein [Clostridium formicaceticum]AOY76474.1 sigma E positive regulator RseC/MucC [Clostridium formicaceticum]ARE86876.1 SoxR reducing system protein RseC [Clostridium formicaceticum]
MEKIGLIKSLEGDKAIVEIRRASACGENCASCKGGCTPTAVYVTAKNHANASVGQYVKLKLESKKVIKAAFLVYLIPLLGMFFGIAAGLLGAEYLGYGNIKELIAAGAGFLMLALAYVFISYKDKKIKEGKEMEIVISHIMS